MPQTTDAEVGRIQDSILAFEPVSTMQTGLQSQTLLVFDEFVAECRQRLALARLALPGVLSVVIAVGAVLNTVLIGLIQVTNLRVHFLVVGIIALFVALSQSAVARLDHAYSGPIAVDPVYFQDSIGGLFIELP